MTRLPDVPDYPDDLLDAWNGTAARVEPSPTIHPSMRREPRTLHIVGSAWRAHEQPDGLWLFTHSYRPVWRATGSVADVWCLLADMHDQDPPGGGLGRDGGAEHDPRRVPSPSLYRGLGWGLLLSAPIWFAGVYTVGRLAGWW